MQRLVEDISRTAIESGKEASEAKATPIVREKRLRIKQPARIAEVRPGVTGVPIEGTFSKLAVEYFLGLLVGKFWTFMHDEQDRGERTVHRKVAYHRAGTCLILSLPVLADFLGTVAVLIHAGRHSPAFLEEKEHEAAVLTSALELDVVVLDGSSTWTVEDHFVLITLYSCWELANGPGKF